MGETVDSSPLESLEDSRSPLETLEVSRISLESLEVPKNIIRNRRS